MLDFRSVSIKGAINFARARVLWDDRLLRVYDATGLQMELGAAEPVRRKGFLSSWQVKTSMGNIIMRSRCMTCGGRRWWRILSKSSSELWGMA